MTKEKKRLRISQSLMRCWCSCKYKYRLIEVEGLKRRRPARPLQVGTLVHTGLEAAIRLFTSRVPVGPESATVPNEVRWPTLIDLALDAEIAITAQAYEMERQVKEVVEPDLEWLQKMRENMLDAIHIVQRTCEFLRLHEGEDCPWETVRLPDGTPCIELEMLSEEGEYDIGGKLDWLIRERETGYVWLVDFKTRDTIQSPEFDAKQVQGPLYLYLLANKHDMFVRGTATIQIRRRVPDVPTLNKTKRKDEIAPGMSRRVIATDWETYERAVIDAGLDPMDYLDMKAKLRPFFAISWEPRAWVEVEKTVHTAHQIAADIMRTPPEDMYRARHPMNCIGCDMEPLCTASLHGHDVEFLKATEYTDSDDPVIYFEYSEEEEVVHADPTD
jgi:hypothetical protein